MKKGKNSGFWVFICVSGWLLWTCIMHFNSVIAVLIYISLATMSILVLGGIIEPRRSSRRRKAESRKKTSSKRVSQERPARKDSRGRKKILPEGLDYSDSPWFEFSVFLGMKYSEAAHTPIEAPLWQIYYNAQKIAAAVEHDKSRENISYLRRFMDVVYMEAANIDDYIACCTIVYPGKKTQQLKECIENRLCRLADISNKLLDEVYSYNLEFVAAGDDMIDQIFSGLGENEIEKV